MLPGIDTGGGGFSASTSATATGRNELTSGHVFNFGDSSTLSPLMIGGIILVAALFVYMGKK